ncbi:hypothetical protein MMC10_008015 [Thelotrema lepadinum]|nr:hypothetical protein [Thelotrema lepadinum]
MASPKPKSLLTTSDEPHHSSGIVKIRLPRHSTRLTLAANEPELPPLSRQPPTQPRPILTRKRTIDSVLYSNSSDPPLFSSDDVSVSLDNYDKPRRKKVYIGSWWSSSQEAAPRDQPSERPKKRAFKRNYDSGIWMGSDESTEVDSEDPGDGEHAGQASPPPKMATSIKRSHMNRILKPTDAPVFSSKQKEAIDTVQQCAENSQENVDLSRLELGVIPWSILEPMRYITREPPSSSDFITLKPKLRLYLAQNNLFDIPAQVFDLEHLTTLSLRCNNIFELSPFISRLEELEDLNLSSNALHYFPYEILSLSSKKLRSLRLEPNPIYEPVIEIKRMGDDPFSRGFPSMFPDCKAISRVAYFDMRGLLVAGSIAPSSSTSAPLPKGEMRWHPEEHERHRQSTSGVSSLYEHALHLSAKWPDTDKLTNLLPDGRPEYMLDGLKRVAASKAAGLPTCAVCKRKYLVHRTEWLEWWTGLPDHKGFGVPLLKRGCSWKCLPSRRMVQYNAMECGWRVIRGY